MITKFVLIIWVGYGNQQVLSTDTFPTLAECEAVADTLKTSMEYQGWYTCTPYTFQGQE